MMKSTNKGATKTNASGYMTTHETDGFLWMGDSLYKACQRARGTAGAYVVDPSNKRVVAFYCGYSKRVMATKHANAIEAECIEAVNV